MLLSGRQVVDELARLGLGTWTPDAVRQWIREQPPCPVAERADRGKPNRFRLLDVLTWLLERERRAKARGYTTTAATQLVERLEVVLRHFVHGTAPLADPAASATPPPPLPCPGPDGPLDPPSTDFAPAPAPRPPADWEGLTDIEAVLAVLRGEQPQAWKAVEEALNQRRRRLEAEGRLVAVDEVEQMLSSQALAVRAALQAVVPAAAQRIADQSTFEQRRAILQTAVDDVLTRLSRDDQEDGVPLAEAA